MSRTWSEDRASLARLAFIAAGQRRNHNSGAERKLRLSPLGILARLTGLAVSVVAKLLHTASGGCPPHGPRTELPWQGSRSSQRASAVIIIRGPSENYAYRL